MPPKQPAVRVTPGTHRKATAAADELDLTLQEYADAAIAYFADRGLNPVDARVREGTLIMSQIKKLGDRVFSYLQEQERTLLLTLLETVVRTLVEVGATRRTVELLASQDQEEFAALRKRNNAAIDKDVETILSGVKRPGQRGEKGEKKQN
ncbi:BfmA/BtgA family mobilization protein [Hymenobacter jeollabukensis]|uniref:Uncharacterized protein n=1 Tax=Hymenobacter jeollabukensis TaxID=2025313 RepID=A0A5R8WJD7_9BACT|nr:BfmA/BtgA family mobilization protein [Hymenobacter jeollabukensis]TLM88723.1 hypothetical protein FDY95_23090 [Hymenobacter jeollabukensis]